VVRRGPDAPGGAGPAPTDEKDGQPLLEIGRIVGAHGTRGWVRVHVHDADSSTLQVGHAVRLRDGRALTVREWQPVPGHATLRRVRLQGVDDRDGALALQGSELFVARKELPPLDADEYYLADAIGTAVEREHEGAVQMLGTIVAITSNGAQDLFEIEWRDPEGRGHRWLLPALPQFVRDVDARRVLVDVPEGFLPEGLEAETEAHPEPEDGREAGS
jgi:16S rRNA processing protein RimM